MQVIACLFHDRERGEAEFEIMKQTCYNQLIPWQSTLNIFHKFYYDDTSDSFRSDLDSFDYNIIANTCVKVIVVRKNDFSYFESSGSYSFSKPTDANVSDSEVGGINFFLNVPLLDC